MKALNLNRFPAALAVLAMTATLLAGCKGDVLDYRNAQVVNGKVYAGDANSPFSGKVTDVPISNILNEQAGYQNMIQNSALVVPEPYRAGLNFMEINQILCDAKVQDGVLDGDAVCKGPRSDVVRMKMTFDHAALSGSLTLFDRSGDVPVLSADFRNGMPDGTEKIYYAPTQQLIGEFPWARGSLDGTVKTYDGKSGNVLLEAHYENGKVNGDLIRYAADGKHVIYHATYADGRLNGAEDWFDPNTGALTRHTDWQAGIRVPTPEEAQATAQTLATLAHIKKVKACIKALRDATPPDPMDVRGEQEAKWSAACEQRFPSTNNDETMPTSPSSATSNTDNRSEWPTEDNACTQGWLKRFRKESGPDAVVTYDMAWEWVDDCRAGKQP